VAAPLNRGGIEQPLNGERWLAVVVAIERLTMKSAASDDH
jgi:hypothetical protein